MNFNTLLRLALLALSCSFAFVAKAQTLYSDPLQLQPYVTEPAKLIKAGMSQYQWQVESEQNGKIVALLDYKNHLVKVNVHYTAERIWLEPLSASYSGPCKIAVCSPDEDSLTRWYLGLYRGIALAFTKEALRDATLKAYQ